MPPRILTPLGVTYVGYSKDTVEAFFGSVSEYRTSLRMPRDLSLKATRLREDFGCSDNDIFVVALAEWMDIVDGLRAEGPRAHVPEEEPRIPEAPGAGPAPDEAVAGDFMQTLDDRLTRPRPWTVEDRGALKDFRDRTTDALVLILVGRGRMTPTALIGGLPVLLKLEALAAGVVVNENTLRDILRPRVRQERSHVVDGHHYRFEEDNRTFRLVRCDPSGKPRLVR